MTSILLIDDNPDDQEQIADLPTQASRDVQITGFQTTAEGLDAVSHSARYRPNASG